MSESVCVGVRVRPFNSREMNLNAELCIEMNGPTTSIRASDGKATPFTFDESFWSHDGFDVDENGYSVAQPGSNYADQRYVFETFGQRVLKNAWEGFHCCLFAYGQTGAGKSYSMVGYGANKGIVPITCEEIFIRIADNDNPVKRYEVTVSMIEIYNEAVQDLLVLPEDRPKKGLEIRESKLLGIYIDGVTKKPVDSYEAIDAVIEEATSHRTVGATLMNATSSRAHTVQTIEFKQVEKIGAKESVKISMINLVDLAGSEKAGQTGASGDRLKEGCAINSSLTALGNVIEKLAERSMAKGKKAQQVIIPYRNSKLTRLLQNALGGSSKTIMICALSPASSNYEETLSTLRYADRAKKIKNTAVVNENPQDKILRELREENEKLKTMMTGGGGEVGDVAAMKEKEFEIAEMQKALEEMQKSFEDKKKEAKERDIAMAVRKRTSIGLSNANPHIMNLNPDFQLNGKLKYSFIPDYITVIGGYASYAALAGSDSENENSDGNGSDSESGLSTSSSDSDSSDDVPVDIAVAASGVLPKHASVVNFEGCCYLNAYPKAVQATFVNGRPIQELQQSKTETVNSGDEDEDSEASSNQNSEHDVEQPNLTNKSSAKSSHSIRAAQSSRSSQFGSISRPSALNLDEDMSDDGFGDGEGTIVHDSVSTVQAPADDASWQAPTISIVGPASDGLPSDGATTREPSDELPSDGESICSNHEIPPPRAPRNPPRRSCSEHGLSDIKIRSPSLKSSSEPPTPSNASTALKTTDKLLTKRSVCFAAAPVPEFEEADVIVEQDDRGDSEDEDDTRDRISDQDENEAKGTQHVQKSQKKSIDEEEEIRRNAEEAEQKREQRMLARKIKLSIKTGIELKHGDRVAFGKSFFLFVDPAVGHGEVLVMSGQATYFTAKKEMREFGGMASRGSCISPKGFRRTSNQDKDHFHEDLRAPSTPHHRRHQKNSPFDDQDGDKDELLSALEDKDKEIAELKRYALMSPDAIVNSSDGEISNLRRQLAEAAQALERAGAPVPRCLEAAQDKTTQAFIDAKQAEALHVAKEAKGVDASFRASMGCAVVAAGALEAVAARLDFKDRAYGNGATAGQLVSKRPRPQGDRNAMLRSARKCKLKVADTLRKTIAELDILTLPIQNILAEEDWAAVTEGDLDKIRYHHEDDDLSKMALMQRQQRELEQDNDAFKSQMKLHADQEIWDDEMRTILHVNDRGYCRFSFEDGILTLHTPIRWTLKQFKQAKVDEPVAEFLEPDQVKPILEDVDDLYKFYAERRHIGVIIDIGHTVIKPGCPTEKRCWYDALAMNRIHLVKDKLVHFGIPADCMKEKVADHFDSNICGIYFVFKRDWYERAVHATRDLRRDRRDMVDIFCPL